MAKSKKEVAIEDIIADEAVNETVVSELEVVLNVPAPEVEGPGHKSRDFSA